MPAPTDSIEISALTAGAALDGTEIVPIVQAAATVRTTFSAALTYFNANASLDAARITGGTLAVARGGTNIGSYAVGDLLYASGATTLAKLAGVATGNALISGGVATAPSWGKIDLTSHITGILPSANGGTGVSNAGTITNANNTTILNGGTLDLGGFTLTVPATGSAALLAVANIFTAAQTTQRDAIGTTSTDGLVLANATAAAAGAQQYSPRLRLTGQGWKTNATAASQTVDWAISNVPVQAAANPSSALTFSSSINGSAYTNFLTLTNTGAATATLAVTGNLQTSGDVIVGININMGLGWWAMHGNGATTGIGFGSGHVITWKSSSTSTNITGDTGLARNGAGVAEVNNGTPGQWAALKAGTRDAGTTTITDGLTLGHQSTGTPAAGFGAAIQINLNSSTTADQNAVRLTSEWVVATHASRTARYKINVYDTASRECLRAEASGSAAMIGFLGANAAIQQTGGAQTATGTYGATEQDMLQKAYDALRTFGLLA